MRWLDGARLRGPFAELRRFTIARAFTLSALSTYGFPLERPLSERVLFEARECLTF